MDKDSRKEYRRLKEKQEFCPLTEEEHMHLCRFESMLHGRRQGIEQDASSAMRKRLWRDGIVLLVLLGVGYLLIGSLMHGDTEGLISGGAISMENQEFTLGRNAEVWVEDLFLDGDYSIRFKVEMEVQGDGWVGVKFNTGKNRMYPGLSFLIYPERMIALQDWSRHSHMMRCFPPVCPKREEVEIRFDVYESAGLIDYYFNGDFYGEKLFNDLDQRLDCGEIAFQTAGEVLKATISEFYVEKPQSLSCSPMFAEPAKEFRPFDTVFPKASEPAEVLYYVRTQDLGPELQMSVVALQGLVNREKPQIYTDYTNYATGVDGEHDWLQIYRDKGYKIEEIRTIDEVMSKFINYYTGVIICEPFSGVTANYALNIAITLAGIEDAVPMTQVLYDQIKDRLDLEVIYQVSDQWDSEVEAYKWLYENYWGKVNHHILAHVQPAPFCVPMLDYVVQNRMFAFYSSGTKTREDYYFYLNVLASTPPNTPIIGVANVYWEGGPSAAFDEDALFRTAAELGKFFVYTFSVSNMSVHSGLSIHSVKQKSYDMLHELYDDKVYVTPLISEGENLSWAVMLRGKAWIRPERGDVPKGIGLTPSIIDLAPGVIEYYYNTAGLNDRFFTDGSGIGDAYSPSLHTYGSRYPREYRADMLYEFLEITNDYMARLDMSEIRLFDISYHIQDELIQEYITRVDSISAVFTGYNGVPGGISYKNANYLLDGVPVSHVLAGSAAATYDPAKDGKVLVDMIKKATPRTRPAFINLFVLGNYVNNSYEVLNYAQKQLGEQYVFVRPDEFAHLLKQYEYQREQVR